MGKQKKDCDRTRKVSGNEIELSTVTAIGCCDTYYSSACFYADVIELEEEKMLKKMFGNKKGMEMVQVAILISIAIIIGLIFKTEITEFVNNTFSELNG